MYFFKRNSTVCADNSTQIETLHTLRESTSIPNTWHRRTPRNECHRTQVCTRCQSAPTWFCQCKPPTTYSYSSRIIAFCAEFYESIPPAIMTIHPKDWYVLIHFGGTIYSKTGTHTFQWFTGWLLIKSIDEETSIFRSGKPRINRFGAIDILLWGWRSTSFSEFNGLTSFSEFLHS